MINESKLSEVVENIVGLGKVDVPSEPSIEGVHEINRCLSRIIINRQTLAEYACHNLIKEKTLRVNEEQIATEIKILIDDLLIADDTVKAGRNKEARQARARMDPRVKALRTKLFETKRSLAVYKSLASVIEMTEANLKNAKESISRMIALIEIEYQNRN